MKRGRIFLLILSVTSLCLLFIHALTVFDRGDDFDIKYRLKEVSVIRYSVQEYLQFDGRSLNPGYLISRACMKSDIPWLASAIATLLWLFSSYLILLLSGIQRRVNQLTLTVFIACSLWLSAFFILSNTLYYQTCTLYITELFLIIWSYYVVYSRTYVKSPVLSGLLFVGAGCSSPHATFALIFVLLMEQLNPENKLPLKSKQVKLILSLFGLGILVVVCAPGSYQRLAMHGGFEQKQLESLNNFYFFIQQMSQTLYQNTSALTWIIIAIGSLAALNQISGEKNKLRSTLYHFRWLIAAFFTLFFFIPKGFYYLSYPRLTIHFIFFSFLFLISQYPGFNTSFRLHRFTKQVLLSGLLLFFLGLAGSEGLNAWHSAKKMQVRLDLYRSHSDRDLRLKAADIIGEPRTHRFEDVQCDSTAWINQTTARYFGIRSLWKEEYR